MHTRPPQNLKRGVLIASVLLIGTVAAASGHRYFPIGGGGTEPANPLTTTSRTSGTVTVSGKLDRNRVLVNGDGTVRMELTLEGEDRIAAGAEATPTDLFVVLDRSGSMSGEKLAQAKTATLELLDQLGPRDRFSLITYESGVRMEIVLAEAHGDNVSRWRAIVDSLDTAGGTNMSAGLDLAHQSVLLGRQANRASRVILLSDGQANEGDASVAGLTRRATLAARNEYVLSTVGIGQGFNEELMTALANNGTGNFYYVDERTALAGVFSDEFNSARETVASGLAVILETPDGVTVEDAAGYALERVNGSSTVFRPGTLFAGQKRTIWVRYRVPTTGAGDIRLGTVRAEFSDRGERFRADLSSLPVIARVRDEGEFYAGINKDVWGNGIAVDELNALRMEVSSAIQSGDREGAKQAIEEYRVQNQALNDKLQMPAVAESIESTRALERDLDDAFSGPDTTSKRNRMSKKLKAKGFDGRRSGAKY
ncbi:MAG: VWA domain-containing protein [Myxococcota bacterium]